MKKLLVSSFIIAAMVLVNSVGAFAQCAMCRATVENNVSNGDVGIGAGLNFGIMYLFVMPYLAVSVVAYFWYKKSKANAKAKQTRSRVAW